MNVKVRMKIGLESQAYAAPRAESIELIDEGLLCASTVSSLDGNIEELEINPTSIDWDVQP